MILSFSPVGNHFNATLHTETFSLSRWGSIDTKEVFAAKWLPSLRLQSVPCLYDNEVTGLQKAGAYSVPNVVELHQVWRTNRGDAYILQE